MLRKVAVLALLLALAFGAMLLTTRETTFAVQDSLTVARPAAEVWAVLTSVEEWPVWWPGVERARLSPAWQEGAVLDLILKGTPEKSPAAVASVTAGRSLAWERVGLFGSVVRTSLRLEDAPGGTRVAMESSIRGPQAFLAGFTGREEFGRYQRAVLAGLKGRAER